MIKGREIEEVLNRLGFERGTRHLLRELAEGQMALNASQIELAQAFTKIADSISAVASGYVDLRKQTERLVKASMFERDFDGDKSS